MKKLLIILVIFMATINESVAANTLSKRQLHIATHVAVENSKPGLEPNEWLEPVTDEEYNKLQAK